MPQDLSAVPLAGADRAARHPARDGGGRRRDVRHPQAAPRSADWLPILPTDRAAWRRAVRRPDRLAMTLAVELDGEVIGDLFLA